MPTAHRRHAITETDDIKNALKVASRAWPYLSGKPGALLRRLILVGGEALAADDTAVADKRQQAIDATSASLSGVFGPDYLRKLRKDWPG